MAEKKKRKYCFVVCPIGADGSDTRRRMEGNFREVIRPVTEEFGYRSEIAIHDKGPGIVTEGIVTKLIEADLVIADLHDHNPNVMYEVAIRHATGDPIIQMIEHGEAIPFDIGGLNTIQYSPGVDGLKRWREGLRAALKAVQEGDAGSNPVARASVYRGLTATAEPVNKALAEILDRLDRLASSTPERRVAGIPVSLGTLESEIVRELGSGSRVPFEGLAGQYVFSMNLDSEHVASVSVSELSSGRKRSASVYLDSDDPAECARQVTNVAREMAHAIEPSIRS